MLESLSVAALLFQPLLHRPRIACCDSLNTSLLSSFHLFPPPPGLSPALSLWIFNHCSFLFFLFCFVFFLSLASFSLFSPSVFVFIYHPLSLFFPPASFFSKPVLYLSTNFRRPEEVVHLYHPTLLSLCNLFEFPVSEKWEMFSPLNIGAAL